MRLESPLCRKCKLEATACRKYKISLGGASRPRDNPRPSHKLRSKGHQRYCPDSGQLTINSLLINNKTTFCLLLYGSRTRVAAVKETRFTVIQWNFAAWIALYRTLRT